MKSTDIFGFIFTAIFLLIAYFIIRNITFSRLWVKIIMSIFLPLILLIGSIAIINILKCPLYYSEVAGLCWLGLTLEMFICTKRRKNK